VENVLEVGDVVFADSEDDSCEVQDEIERILIQ